MPKTKPVNRQTKPRRPPQVYKVVVRELLIHEYTIRADSPAAAVRVLENGLDVECGPITTCQECAVYYVLDETGHAVPHTTS